MEEPLHLAHISDLHFPYFDWKGWLPFSKRMLGLANFFLRRKKYFNYEPLERLPRVFKDSGVTHLLVTGDVTVTSAALEFKKAHDFLKQIEEQGIEVFCIPGNHDQYTKGASREDRFYKYFPSCWDGSYHYDLKKQGITLKKISSKWWLIGLDTAFTTSWLSSKGRFSPLIEANLIELLQLLPVDACAIMMNHFPFFHLDHSYKELERGERLKEILARFRVVKLFCHGHTHRPCLANLKASGLPHLIDSGSTPERLMGGWNLLNLSHPDLRIHRYRWIEESWKVVSEELFPI